MLQQKAIHIINNKKVSENHITSPRGKRIDAEPNAESLIRSFASLKGQYIHA